MRDLKRDGEALGVEQCQDNKRLQPVESISKRPIFSKNTRIHKMQEKLDKDKKKYDKAVLTGKVYNHIRERMIKEKSITEKKNRDMKMFVEKRDIRNHENNRDLQYLEDQLVHATADLDILKKDVEADLKLWEDTISEREWARKRKCLKNLMKSR